MKSDYEIKRDQELKDWLQPKKKGLPTAFVILFLFGGYIIGSTLIGIYNAHKLYENVPFFYKYFNVFIGCFYVLLSITSIKYAFESLLVGFVIYIGIILWSAMIDITSLYKGILVKILVIPGFIYALSDSRKEKRKSNEVLDEEIRI